MEVNDDASDYVTDDSDNNDDNDSDNTKGVAHCITLDQCNIIIILQFIQE